LYKKNFLDYTTTPNATTRFIWSFSALHEWVNFSPLYEGWLYSAQVVSFPENNISEFFRKNSGNFSEKNSLTTSDADRLKFKDVLRDIPIYRRENLGLKRGITFLWGVDSTDTKGLE